jgi:hypothetical protein
MVHYYTLKENVLSKYKNPIFFETGTYLGDSVELAINIGFKKIISIEIDESLQNKNIKKFESYVNSGQVELIVGDTIIVMEEIIKNINQPTTFWLDAHVDTGITGIKMCPLYEELEYIKSSPIKNHTIMIDDLRIFGGGNWGSNIKLDDIKNKILMINSNYKFSLEDGCIPADILVAYL